MDKFFSVCILNEEEIRFNFSFKYLEVKEGDNSTGFDIQIVLEIVFTVKCEDSHQNGHVGFWIPWCCSSPELMISFHTEAGARRVHVVKLI